MGGSLDSFFVCPSSEDSSPSYFTNIANSQQTPDTLGNDKMRSAHVSSSLSPPRPVSTVVANALLSAQEQRSPSQAAFPAQDVLENLNIVGLASPAAPSTRISPISSEEDYVPSITSHVIEPSAPNSAENANHDSLIQETGPLPTGEGTIPHANDPPIQSVELDMIDNNSENVGTNETESGLDRSLPMADANDSDDYEPPEPALMVNPSTDISTEPLTETVFSPSAIVNHNAKSLVPSSMSVLEPLSELTEMSPALPVNGELSVVTTETAKPKKLMVRFFPARLIYLNLLSGYKQACKSRDRFLCTLRKPAEEVQIISIPSRISSRCSARFSFLDVQSWY